MTVARRCGWLAVMVLACGACVRSSSSIELMAPFSDDTVVGQLTVTWSDGGEERAGAAPDTAERRVRYRVDALNRLSDGLCLRLHDLRLIGPDGPLATAAPPLECRLASGATVGVLAGALWVPARQAAAIRAVQVDHLAVPLSERGRALYREFLLAQRPGAASAIDAELDAYAAAPPCQPVP